MTSVSDQHKQEQLLTCIWNNALNIALASKGLYYSTLSEISGAARWESFQGGYYRIAAWRAKHVRDKTAPSVQYGRLLAPLGLQQKEDTSILSGSEESRSRRQSQFSLHQTDESPKRDPFGGINGEDAHQVPDYPASASAYSPILHAVLGLVLEAMDVQELATKSL